LISSCKTLVLTVLPGIHCAIGYGLANSMLIEGDQGNILIDTLESAESASELKKDFEQISSKPIVAIIYTHNHADHVHGTRIFAQDNFEQIQIYSHEKLVDIIDNTMSLVQPITFQRASRQFGIYLTRESGHINAGIGSLLKYNQNSTRAFVYPTETFNTSSKLLTIAGRDLILYFAPGETDDQIVIYMPNERVLFAADNIYKAFPNIYAIRGTTARDARQWISSLDLMRNLHSEYLIPSHTKPIQGKREIFDILTKYRDAIQFAHDQTVRFMNQGLTPDEIIGNQLIQLPEQLRTHPYLQEFYGTLNWSIRAIFDRYMGWFSGKTSDLNPDSPKTRAENLIKLGGGSQQVFDKAQQAFQQNQFQWVLELTEALLVNPQDVQLAEVKQLQCQTLKQLALQQTSANGRNWYLTKIVELEKSIEIKPSDEQKQQTILNSSIKQCFFLLPVYFNYGKVEDITKNQLFLFAFDDSNEKFSIEIRNGIVEIHNQWSQLDSAQIIVQIKSELIWKQIIAKLKTPIEAFEDESIVIKDKNQQDYPEGIVNFLQFLVLFTP